jgi:hypothetical protein
MFDCPIDGTGEIPPLRAGETACPTWPCSLPERCVQNVALEGKA